MNNIFLGLGCLMILSCSSNEDLIGKINQEIDAETRKIENNNQEAKIDIQQMEFLSIEMEAAKLKSNIDERNRAAKEIADRVRAILIKGKQREIEDSISAAKLDSLMVKKNELIRN